MIKNNYKILSFFFLFTLVIKFSLFLILKNDIYFASTFVDEKWVLEHLDGRELSLYVYSPAYVVFLKLYSFIFPVTKIPIQVFQIVSSSAINTLIFFFLMKVSGSVKAFFIALMPVFFAPAVLFSLRILPAAVWPELFILSILLLFISIQNSKMSYYYIGSSILVFAAFMRPNLFLLVPVIAIYFFILKKSVKTFVPVVLTVLFLIAIGFINYSETEEFIPLTANGGINFFMGNNEFSDGIYMPVKDVRDEIGLQLKDSVRIYADNTGDNEPTYGEASSWWYAKGFSFLKENPGKAASLYLKKSVLMFRSEEHSSSFSTDLILERTFLPFFGFSLLLGLFVFGLIMSFRFFGINEKFFMVLCLFFSFAGVITFIIDSRYRLGFSVTILTFIMLFAARLDLKRVLEYRSKLTVAVVAAVMIFVITAFPKHSGNLYYAWYSLGNLYVEKEDWQDALDSFSKALKDNPDYSHAWNNLGMTYMMLEKKSEAQKAFKKAVGIAPENSMFRENLKRSETGN